MTQITVNIGDRVRARKQYKTDQIVHIEENDVFLVIAMKQSPHNGSYPIVDWCRCDKKGGGHMSGEFSWSMDDSLFENLGPLITPEEFDKAKFLPSPDDVASFMVKHGSERIS